jgi:hypothetical protein
VLDQEHRGICGAQVRAEFNDSGSLECCRHLESSSVERWSFDRGAADIPMANDSIQSAEQFNAAIVVEQWRKKQPRARQRHIYTVEHESAASFQGAAIAR